MLTFGTWTRTAIYLPYIGTISRLKDIPEMSFPNSFYRWRPHPWHGLEVGPDPPGLVHVYIETGPFDLVKYEVDKETGYLRVDRPHRSSSHHPTLYGFVPRTYCGERVCELMEGAQRGDQDPLDICVVSERPIERAEVIVNARVVGGLPMLDGGEADDKIIAVLENDPFWSQVEALDDLPSALIDRLRHYFETYKVLPNQPVDISIGPAYGREHAEEVIQAAMKDYEMEFGGA
jgi:inorganic pyrophosphatase